jgi:hypothetical protein
MLHGVDAGGLTGELGFNTGGYPGDPGTVALVRLKLVAVGIPNSVLIIDMFTGPVVGIAILSYFRF